MSEWHNGVEVITFFVDDLERAKAFYRDTFGLAVEYESDSSVVLDCGNLGLNLLVRPVLREAPDDRHRPIPGPGLQITIDVDDVDAVCEDLTARGMSMLSAPTDRSGGFRNAIFTDPDGYVWEIAQQLPHAPALTVVDGDSVDTRILRSVSDIASAQPLTAVNS